MLVALRHPAMRAWTRELLASDHGCWEMCRPGEAEGLADALGRIRPDLAVVDERDLQECLSVVAGRSLDLAVIAVGPEPDPAYRSSALRRGATGWVARDALGQELGRAMRDALGCRHEPCPSSTPAKEGSST